MTRQLLLDLFEVVDDVVGVFVLVVDEQPVLQGVTLGGIRGVVQIGENHGLCLFAEQDDIDLPDKRGEGCVRSCSLVYGGKELDSKQ